MDEGQPPPSAFAVADNDDDDNDWDLEGAVELDARSALVQNVT